MELLDGYIVGIYNYCDRWCETCPFTARCRLFAMSARFDAGDDPVFAALGAGLARSTAAMTDALRTAASLGNVLDEDDDDDEGEIVIVGAAGEASRTPPASHEALRQRAMSYGLRTSSWLQSQPRTDGRPPDDAFGVVAWFHHMISAKVDRALHGLEDAQGRDPEAQSDAEGSAKVALLGAERSRAAWVDLVCDQRIHAIQAAPFIDTLTTIIDELDALLPGGRTFVRPGFDEPDEVARLRP